MHVNWHLLQCNAQLSLPLQGEHDRDRKGERKRKREEERQEPSLENRQGEGHQKCERVNKYRGGNNGKIEGKKQSMD